MDSSLIYSATGQQTPNSMNMGFKEKERNLRMTKRHVPTGKIYLKRERKHIVE
jgi:hypothetical protein